MQVILLNPANNLYKELIIYDQNRNEIATATSRRRGAPNVIGLFFAQPDQTYYIAVFSGDKPSLGHIDEESSTEFYTLKVERKK